MEIDELATLIAIAPPPFVFVHDAVCLRDTISALECALASEENTTAHVRRATVNGISCFTPRLLYDHAINSLADWSVEWNEGCANWTLPSSSGRWNDSFDSFVRGLRTLHTQIRSNRTSKTESGRKTRGKKKAKGKQKEAEEGFEEEVRFAIVIEHAERLRSNMPDLLVPLTRLAELVCTRYLRVLIMLILTDSARPYCRVRVPSPVGRYEATPWCIARPIFLRYTPAQERTYGSLHVPLILVSDRDAEIVKRLEEHFDSSTKSDATALHRASTSRLRRSRGKIVNAVDQPPLPPSSPELYHPSLRQLFNDFVSILCDVCYPFTHDPREIQYIAAARWPGFVQPVLDEHNQRIDRARCTAGQAEDMCIDKEYSEDEDVEEGDEHEDLRPPSADTRLKLSRLFKPTLTNALEELYPRITNATVWANLNSSPPDPDSISLSRPSSPVKPGGEFVINVNPTPQTPRKTRSLRSSAPNTHTPHTPYTPRTPRATSYAHTYADGRTDPQATGLSALPRMSKFIIIAAFLASTNPAKSDVRMFGRGLDEKKRRKRRASTKAGNGPAKVIFHFA